MGASPLGVIIKNQTSGWIRYLKCEKIDHNVVRMLHVINFYTGINIQLDFGKQVQATHLSGVCEPTTEAGPFGETIAGKNDLELFSWTYYADTLRVYWVENGTWYYLEGKVQSCNFSQEPYQNFWTWRLDFQAKGAKTAGAP